MKERIFIKEAGKYVQIENFIKQRFSDVKCGNIDVQRTPLGTRIIIHTLTPGIIIGNKGKNIEELNEEIKEKFGIKNPQIDVQKVKDPDLEPNIVAQKIAASIERGVNYKKLGNFYLSKIMDAGAIGAEIVIAGKFSGERGRTARFIDGYVKKAGHEAELNVVKGFATANPKLGTCGITVSIMLRRPKPILNLPEEDEEKKSKKETSKEQKKSKKEEKSEKTEKKVKKTANKTKKTKKEKPKKKVVKKKKTAKKTVKKKKK